MNRAPKEIAMHDAYAYVCTVWYQASRRHESDESGKKSLHEMNTIYVTF